MNHDANPVERTCWVVTDGRPGNENGALGLAEAIAAKIPLSIIRKPITVKPFYRRLPRHLWASNPFIALSREGSLLRPPNPDLWIGCGKVSAPFTMAAKKRDSSMFAVQLQNPRIGLGVYDLCCPPQHDQLEGDNVVSTLGSPNRISAMNLLQGAKALTPLLEEKLPRPIVGFLIGGDNGDNKITDRQIRRVMRAVHYLHDKGASLLIAASRRTPELLREQLVYFGDRPNVFVDRGEGVSHYLGVLALADCLMVTEDSVNMITEAATTGKPVHIFQWQKGGTSTGKFVNFHEQMQHYGATKVFTGRLPRWKYDPLKESERLAEEVLKRWLPDASQPTDESLVA